MSIGARLFGNHSASAELKQGSRGCVVFVAKIGQQVGMSPAKSVMTGCLHGKRPTRVQKMDKGVAFQIYTASCLGTGILLFGICLGSLIEQQNAPEPVVITQVEEVVKTERVEVPVEKVLTVEVQKVVPRKIETELTDTEKELIARVVMSEAAYEDMIGKRLVVDTILNRVDSPSFPDSVYGVVYQKGQFYKATSYSTECMDAVEQEIYERLDYDVLWFASSGYLPYGTKAYQHGGHYFCWRKK